MTATETNTESKDMDDLTNRMPTPSKMKDLKLKPLAKQVIVITGASSGIGLVTARMAVERGASVVLVSRNEEVLRSLVEEIIASGGRAVYAVADVGKQDDVANVAHTAIEAFGGFDTWVNNAGVSIFGAVDEVSIEDQRKMFETNYWGVVYGSLEAIKHYKERESDGWAGSLINTGSFFGDRATPVQSTYSATKHALHGWTDALRMEMEAEQAPISVTLLHPGRIDTPYDQHAQNYLPTQPAHRDMIYPPEAVAEATLWAATHPMRDMFIGSQSKALVLLAGLSPRLMDRFMERYMFWSQQRADVQPTNLGESSLHEPSFGLAERGIPKGWVRRRSYYVEAEKHREVALIAVGALVALRLLSIAAKAGKR
jgi:short-subunit dehydrogenase